MPTHAQTMTHAGDGFDPALAAIAGPGLMADGLQAVRSGQTTLAEMARVAQES